MKRTPRPHPFLPVQRSTLATIEIAGRLALADPTTARSRIELRDLGRCGMVLAQDGIGIEVLPLAEKALVEIQADDPDVVLLEQMLDAVLTQLKLINSRQFAAMQATVIAMATAPSPRPE